MSALAHVVLVAICGGVAVGALGLVAAHWVHDALHPSMSATLGLGGEQLPDEEAGDLDDEADSAVEVDADAWDRARDAARDADLWPVIA